MTNIMIENACSGQKDFISITFDQLTMIKWLYERGYLGDYVSWCENITFNLVTLTSDDEDGVE